MLRAKYMWPIAQHERRGVPIDLPTLDRIRYALEWTLKPTWSVEKNEPFGVYEIGRRHAALAQATFCQLRASQPHGLADLANGVFDESDEAFKTMEGRYPQVRELRQLRYSLSKCKLHELQVGSDGRQSHSARCVRQQDRAQRTVEREVYFRAGEVAALPDHAATRPRT